MFGAKQAEDFSLHVYSLRHKRLFSSKVAMSNEEYAPWYLSWETFMMKTRITCTDSKRTHFYISGIEIQFTIVGIS